MTEWRAVPGWEWKYAVSDDGRVRNILKGVEVKAWLSNGGYKRVHLLNPPSIHKVIPVHVLVAAAFIGCRPVGYDVHHRYENKENNTPDNLEYVLKGEHNIIHKSGHSYTVGENHPRAKLTESQVGEIRALLAEGGMTQQSIGDRYGVGRGSISQIKYGHTWAHLLPEEERV